MTLKHDDWQPGCTRVVNLHNEPCDVRIDRTTKWGNPYRIGRDGDRAEVVRRYAAYLDSRPDLLAALPELVGKRWGCWCWPLPCHGDVLLDRLFPRGQRR